MTNNVRRIDYDAYVRDTGEMTSGGHHCAIHLASEDDTSPAHATYPRGYDSRCGWCYLGAPHSEAAHVAKVAASV